MAVVRFIRKDVVKPGDSNVILKILWTRVFYGVEFPKLKIGATWSNVLFFVFHKKSKL